MNHWFVILRLKSESQQISRSPVSTRSLEIALENSVDYADADQDSTGRHYTKSSYNKTIVAGESEEIFHKITI